MDQNFLLKWDQVGEKTYEMGCDRGVLYLQDDEGKYTSGEVWNGLINITENPGGAESTDMYADNIKYGSMRSAETFGCTIEAYTYPTTFERCDGTAELAPGITVGQQTRIPFGLSYRTMIGNDTASEKDDGYKIHLVYGATASPSDKTHETINESPEAVTFSWEVSTVSIPVPGFKPAATIVIDSTKCDPEVLEKIEAILYGLKASNGNVSAYADDEDESVVPGTEDTTTEEIKPRLPLPEEIMEIISKAA